MKAIYNSLKNHSLLYSFILVSSAFLTELPTLVSSEFIFVYYNEVFGVFLASLLILAVVYKITASYAAVYFTANAAIIANANVASQAFLYYSCKLDSEYVIYQTIIFTTLIVTSALILCMVLSINKIRNNPWIVCIIISLIAVALSIMVIFFTSNSNTSTVVIFGIEFQPAFIMIFISLVCSAGILWQRSTNAQRVFYFSAIILINAGLVFRHEWGAPIIIVVSIIITSLLLHSKLNIKLPLALLGFFGICAVALLLTHHDLLRDTADKFFTRINVNEQAELAARQIADAGLLGSTRYSYLPEASSDFALNTCTHCFGLLWLIVLLISFSITAIMLWIEYTQPCCGASFIISLKRLCLATWVVIFVYNVLDNVACCLPIVGVQAPFIGTSKSNALFSGVLLGSILFDEEAIEHVKEKVRSIHNSFIKIFATQDEG